MEQRVHHLTIFVTGVVCVVRDLHHTILDTIRLLETKIIPVVTSVFGISYTDVWLPLVTEIVPLVPSVSGIFYISWQPSFLFIDGSEQFSFILDTICFKQSIDDVPRVQGNLFWREVLSIA